MKKAETLEEIYNVFAHEKFLSPQDKEFYVDLYTEHTEELATSLILNRAPNKTFFVAGQLGNGKSSMLNLLTTNFPNINEKYEFHYIYGRAVFLYDDIDIIDILLMIGSKLIEKDEKLGAKYFDKLQSLKDIKAGALEKSETTADKTDKAHSIKGFLGISLNFFEYFKVKGGFESAYKINEEMRKEARRFFKVQRKELIDITNEIITSYKVDKNDKRELIIIIDDIKKKESIDELFIKDMPLLNELNIVKIIAMPIHLKRNYTFHNGDIIEFALKLKTFDGKEYTKDKELLREVIQKRLEDKSLITDEAIELAIKYSGANVRQLIRFINYAALKAYSSKAEKITETEIESAIEKLGRDYSSQAANMKSFLSEIKEHKLYKEDSEENQIKIAKATKNELVFAYFNGDVWYDINPVIEKALERYSSI